MSSASVRPQDQPTVAKMPGLAEQRLSGGSRAWLTFAIGTGGLALNHWLSTKAGRTSIWLLIFSPMTTLLGAAGVYDLRYMLGAGKYSKALPAKFRVVSAVLVIAGLAISVWLIFGFYHIKF